MSKIGKINIVIPDKVKVLVNGNIINVEGPLGKKSLNLDTDLFDLQINEGKDVSIKPKKITQDIKRLWGMNRSLLNNAIIGASTMVEGDVIPYSSVVGGRGCFCFAAPLR